MASTQSIVFYGDSMFLAGIRAELASHAEFELLVVRPGCPDAVGQISACHPVTVLFDLCSAQPDFAVGLLSRLPEVTLLGVDPSSNKVLVLSGRQEQPVSSAGLVQMIVGGQTNAPGT